MKYKGYRILKHGPSNAEAERIMRLDIVLANEADVSTFRREGFISIVDLILLNPSALVSAR